MSKAFTSTLETLMIPRFCMKPTTALNLQNHPIKCLQFSMLAAVEHLRAKSADYKNLPRMNFLLCLFTRLLKASPPTQESRERLKMVRMKRFFLR